MKRQNSKIIKWGKIITITRITSPLKKHQLKILKNERIDNEKCPQMRN